MDDAQSRTDRADDDVENRRRLFGGSVATFMYGLKDDGDWDLELPEEQDDPPNELPVPTGLELTEADDAYRVCPYAHLEELRERDPVHRDVVLNRLVLTRHADVAAVLDNTDLCCNPAKAGAGTFARPLADDPAREPLLPFMDDAGHARLRGLVSQAFSPAAFEAFRPRIRAIVGTILEDLEENEFEFDAVVKYTARVPMLVTGDLLGIDPTRQSQFKTWADQINNGFFNAAPTDAERCASNAARRNLTDELCALIAARRVTPADDVISTLLRAEQGGDRLSDTEIVDQCFVLLAGTAAIEALLGNGLKALLQNTQQMNLIVEQPDLRQRAVDEMLRFDPPVLSVVRIANVDTVVAGCPIAAGETVWASLAAAHRDPAAFPEPDDYDVKRNGPPHVAFGAGAHSCLGAQLARIEAEEAIFGLIARFEEIETSPQGWEFAPLANLRYLEKFLDSYMTNALSDVSFWFDSLETLPPVTTPPLPQHVDVAIVGAGFTGLWSAYYLHKLEPNLRIAVFEAQRAGFGASGRNGGWCMGMAWGVEGLLRKPTTRSRGVALARALFDTVDEVGRICQAENIDAHFAKGGSLNVATIPFQVEQLKRHVDHLAAAGFDESDYRWLPEAESRTRLAMTPNYGALHFRHCAAIQPARLVLGLADVVRRQGTVIHEGTPVTAIEAGRIVTNRGGVRADAIIRATEGYTDSIAAERRRIMPLYSMVTATEPLPPEVWAQIGLAERETFGDGRRVVMYGQRTLDDRLVLGGRAGYYFASKRRATIPPNDPKVVRVKKLVTALFPMLEGFRITHGWGGLMGVPRHWRPCVQWDGKTRTGWAGGYVGEGVAASNLAGRIVADLVTDRTTALTELPWVNDEGRLWEPEPLRWIGAKAIEGFGDRADRAEFASGTPSKFWGGLFDTFVR